MSSWWADEARQYGVHFEQHEDRYARTAEWLEVVDGLWKQDRFSYAGNYYRVENTILQPKPITRPRPALYAGGESEAAKEPHRPALRRLRHARRPARAHRAKRSRTCASRRERFGLPPMQFGVAAYAIVRDTEREAQAELARITDVQVHRGGFRQLPAVAQRHASSNSA